MKKIFVTGACGYKGTVLVQKLLERSYAVTAVDTQWFGDFLEDHPNLTKIKMDILDLKQENVDGHDVILHLASIANDPCGDLDPKLTWEVSALATMRLADFAVRAGIKQMIYASSGSVYGIKEEEKVTEDLPLEPISEYNKSKMVAERVLLSYADELDVQIVRPATVCGISPRMRLDVAVNMLTMQALTKGEITVLGGNQTRPNIHMDDITDLYIFLLENPQVTGVYNAGFENLKISEIAEMIAEKVNCKITIKESNDPRSYRVDSSKLLATGFKPKKTVADAIQEIMDAYKAEELKDEERFYNLNWMKEKVA
jgi:nucleoside-diphosphate-sugar epimerase